MPTTSELILALFVDDDIVLRPADILRRTGRKTESVRTQLKRLVAAGKLFHIAHSQYARSPNATPIAVGKPSYVAELESRIAVLERQMAAMANHWIP